MKQSKSSFADKCRKIEDSLTPEQRDQIRASFNKATDNLQLNLSEIFRDPLESVRPPDLSSQQWYLDAVARPIPRQASPQEPAPGARGQIGRRRGEWLDLMHAKHDTTDSKLGIPTYKTIQKWRDGITNARTPRTRGDLAKCFGLQFSEVPE